MRLAVLQELAVVNDLEANLATVVDGMRAAADRGADVLVTPELFLTGYAPLAVRAAADPQAIAGVLERVAQACREIGIAAVVSFPAQEPGSGPDGPWRGRFLGGMTLLGLAFAVLIDGGGNIPLYLLVGALGVALVVLALVGRDREVAEAKKAAKQDS